MAKNTQPIAKRCRALGISPAVMGYGKKTTNRNPGGQMRKKKSEYATQLNEKQKVKFVYGILENQFHTYYEKASRMPGQTGVNLLVLVERRLDNVVYRLGFAKTRRDARQLVSHNHFTVNGKRVNIPSYQVKAGDVIEVIESSRSSVKFSKLILLDTLSRGSGRRVEQTAARFFCWERRCGYRYNLHPALQGSGWENGHPDNGGAVCLWAQSEKAGGCVCLSL